MGGKSSQQSKFDKVNDHLSDASKRSIPIDLDRKFSVKLEADLKRNSFFKSRLTTNGPALIQPTLIRYGYRRFSVAEDGEILLSPSVQVEIAVLGGDGKCLLKEIVESSCSQAQRVRAYASNPAMTRTRRAFEKGLDRVIERLDLVWDRKLGNRRQ